MFNNLWTGLQSAISDGKELWNGEGEMWNLAEISENAPTSLLERDGQGKCCVS